MAYEQDFIKYFSVKANIPATHAKVLIRKVFAVLVEFLGKNDGWVDIYQFGRVRVAKQKAYTYYHPRHKSNITIDPKPMLIARLHNSAVNLLKLAMSEANNTWEDIVKPVTRQHRLVQMVKRLAERLRAKANQ